MVIRVQDSYQELPGVRGGQVSNPLSGTTPTDIAGRQAAQMGQGLRGAGAELAKIVQEEQEKANKVRLNDAYNQALTAAHALRYDKDAGYLKLKGADAVKGVQGDDGGYRPITDSYSEKLDSQLAEIRKNLGNDDVSSQFDLVADDLRTKFRNEAVTYEAEQGSVYAQQVRDATIVASANELTVIAPALTSTDPKTAAAAAAKMNFQNFRARQAAVDTARAAGLDGEALTGAVQSAMGKAHTAVITSLLEAKDVASAKAYYQENVDDYSPLEAKAIKAKLDVAVNATVAIGAVDEVLTAYPLIQNVPANKSEMDGALRAKFVDDPEGLKAARAELSQRLGDHEFQETETNAGNVDAVWKLRNAGRSLASVESSSAWLALPGAMQGQLRQQWTADLNDPAKLPSETWQAWLQLTMDEDALAGMTPAQISALEPKFGRSLTQSLSENAKQVKAKRAGVAVAAAFASPKIDTDAFLTIAKDFGLKAYTQDLKSEDAQALAALRYQLETAVAQHQLATKTIIPPGEMPEFLRKTAARIQYGGSRILLETLGIGGEKVKLPNAGTMDSARIAAYLAEKKLPPTVENQRKAYLDILESGALLVDE